MRSLGPRGAASQPPGCDYANLCLVLPCLQPTQPKTFFLVDPTFDLFAHRVAGAQAGMGTVTVTSSLELVWTKLLALHMLHHGWYSCLGGRDPGHLVISVAGLGPH